MEYPIYCISRFLHCLYSAFWGYQAGLGLSFSEKFHLDIRYEGNFDKWGSHINIGSKTYTFQQSAPSRWLVNAGYAF